MIVSLDRFVITNSGGAIVLKWTDEIKFTYIKSRKYIKYDQ